MKNLLMTTIAIFGLATITIAQVPSYVPTNGLVGWWPFTGNANDESGNAYNGTALNGAMLVNDRNGAGNSAYGFDGSDDLIQTTLPYTDLIGSEGLSVSAWINLDSISSFWGYSIITNHFPGSTQFAFALGGTNDGTNHRKLVFFFNSFSGGSQAIYCPVMPIIVNQWTHVGCTVKSDTVNFFIDGSLIFAQPVVFDSLSTEGTAPNVKIGQGNPTSGFRQDWIGFLDDIAIWNRALDSCEIKDLYYASLGNCCNITVNSQPNSQTININNNAQFIAGSSDPSSTFQWQTDLGVGYQNLNSVGQYSGTANDTLTIANTTLSNNNQPFRCIVSSGSCSDTSNVAILTVNNNVGINEFTQDNLFSVYPNPAKSQINVKADAKLLGSIYTVYDNTGKLVLSGKIISENTTIELGNLSGGIYLFSVGENLKQTFKVIKE